MRFTIAVIFLICLLVQPVVGGSFGSGFLISKSGHIITCAHCVPKGAEIAILTHDGYSHEAKVVFRNDDLDLACIKIESNIEYFFPLADSSSAKILDSVYVFGFPLPSAIGNELSASKGSLNSIRNKGGLHLLQVDAPVNPGNSGGPVLNDKGWVIGIAVSKLDPLKFIKSIGTIPERINFAVPSSVLRTELQRNGVKYEKPSKGYDLESMRDLASKATVQVISISTHVKGDFQTESRVASKKDLAAKTYQAAIKYILLGNSLSLEDELSSYAPNVDYYNKGVQDANFIQQDISALRAKWPERYYVIKSVDRVGVDLAELMGSATVHFRFALFNGKKFYRGEASALLIFDLSHDNPKAILVREHKTNKQKG